MKIYITYKFADENPIELEKLMDNIASSLKKSGHEVLTTFFDKEEFRRTNATMRTIMDRALGYLNKSDIVLNIIKSQEKSEGQIFEIGYAVAKNKKLILAIQKGLKTRWIEYYSDKIIEFETLEELYKKLEEIK